MSHRRVGEFKEVKPGDLYVLIPDADGLGNRLVIESNGDEDEWIVKFIDPRHEHLVSEIPSKVLDLESAMTESPSGLTDYKRRVLELEKEIANAEKELANAKQEVADAKRELAHARWHSFLTKVSESPDFAPVSESADVIPTSRMNMMAYCKVSDVGVIESRECEPPYLFYIDDPHTRVFIIERHR
jgi:hypothetical protein